MTDILFDVCDVCAPAIVNHDFTSYDLDIPRVTAFMNAFPVTHTGTTDYAGYWNCEVCKQVQIGTGQLFALDN